MIQKTCKQCGLVFVKPPRVGIRFWEARVFCGQICYRKHKIQSVRCGYKKPSPIKNCSWIPLGHGHFSLIDASLEGKLNQHVWRRDARGYAATKINYRIVLMHRLILGDDTEKWIDHINRNRLDNRIKNLRYATGSANRVNSDINSNNTSGFRGVHYLNKSRKHWCARIGHNMTRVYIGVFDTAEEAALAYDREAKKRFGRVAQLNFGDR